MNKKPWEKLDTLNRLDSIYNLAMNLSQHVKDVNFLLLQLKSQRTQIERWDSLLLTVEELEKKQNLCIRTLREDLQILDGVRFRFAIEN